MALSYLTENSSSLGEGAAICVGEALQEATRLLKDIFIDTPDLDARLLMEQALSCSNLELMLNKERILFSDELARYYRLLARRLTFEPMAYISGFKEFFGHNFLVNAHCLIPRPDTETVVESALALLKDKNSATIIDIGTGSGAIAISMLKEKPNLRAFASDCSIDALKIAETNARKLNVHDRITFLLGDLFAPFSNVKVDLIVANPPYIAEADYKELASDVRDFEPRLALVPGDEHGISIYARLLDQASGFLLDGGFLVVEIGFNQKEMVLNLADQRWTFHGLFYDLAGIARVLVFKKAN